MKNFNYKTLSILTLVAVFSLCSGMLLAISKHDLFEARQKISELQQRIDDAYAQLRLLNEEGGEQAQVQAQALMAEIKIMQSELGILQESIASMKKGGPKLRGELIPNRQILRIRR